MQERIERLREHIEALNGAGVRRTTFFPLIAESLKRTLGEPRPIRRAKAFAHLLDSVVQVVHPHELIVGSIVGRWPLAEGLPSSGEREAEALECLERYREAKREGECGQDRVLSRRWALMARDHYDASVPYDELQRLIGEMQARFADAPDLSDREIGRELERHFVFDYGEQTRRLFAELPWHAANHLDLNYGKVVRRGLRSLRDETVERRAAAADDEARTFYESARIAMDAALRFTERYAATTEAEAGKPAVSAERAAELRAMAAIVRKVARGAPETFREAVQAVWMTHAIANICGGAALSFARFDQYMHPLYRRDVDEGVLARDEAKALVSCVWLKVNEPKMRTVQSLCLAGTTPGGDCGANDLTRLCLEVCREVGQPYPNVSVRVSRATPAWVWDEIVETMKAGIGHPMVLNDEVWVPNFVRLGYPAEAARDYYNMGCVEMMLMGRMGLWAGCGHVPMADLPERVFRHGAADPRDETGAEAGPLESLASFDEFLGAFIAQVGHCVRRGRENAERGDEHRRGAWYDPFASALIDDCLERGRDLYQGGARHAPPRPIGSQGLGTAADALAAVKRLVYDERRLTLGELWGILQADWEGHEALRVECDRRMPCFGNGDPEADAIARRIFAAYANAVHALNDGSMDGPFTTTMFSYTGHIHGGESIMATANGRRAGEPISNGIGPSQGHDVEGPTQLIHSVTALDHAHMTGACAFNLKLNATLVRGEEGSDALKGLLKTYVGKGGCQIQVNFVDPETLRDAQAHPERHRGLIVRVAGYCEYFNSLDCRLQDEVIRRTAHGV